MLKQLLRAVLSPVGKGKASPMFEIFPHTADVGLRIQADDLNSLFEEAGLGLLSLFVANPEAVRLVSEQLISLSGSQIDFLLFDWLNELLFLFETEQLLLARFEVNVDSTGLQAVARGERFDPARHRLEHEVKAITYHGLKAVHERKGWTAELILDI